ncbi:hypothetical protein LTR08_000179 [Meristemomyces frigidus]|nr:hypothetical protein LTR08_000179 [Meristemomyces frigidus]
MDITAFITARRAALLIGDYNAYRTTLARQLHTLRKHLGLATPKREKFAPKSVSAADIGHNAEHAQLLLLTSERAWAHAMHMKTSHQEERKGVTGATRSHVLSRLAKAGKVAKELVELLRQQGASKASARDVLEARAYYATLAGSEEFEKHSSGTQRASDGQASEKKWQPCLRYYAEARVIYAALYESGKQEVFRDVLANTVDPTIRYAAYQAHLSRTIAIETVAKRYFPTASNPLISSIEELDPYALKDRPIPETNGDSDAKPHPTPTQEIPNTITWRARKANIVDASIGQSLAAVHAAEARLRAYLASNTTATSREKAAAYDEVLIASQDAADATKRATDELEKEKLDEGDPRMQDLRITSLAVNYALVSWRVGRNRVLIGEDDGLTFSAQAHKIRPAKRQRTKDNSKTNDGDDETIVTPAPAAPPKQKETDQPESTSRKLARLRERVVLYASIIQSIDSIKALRGAMRDETFVAELDGKIAYFRALKCANIAFSHALLGGRVEALALLRRARDLLDSALGGGGGGEDAEMGDGGVEEEAGAAPPPPTLTLPLSQIKTAHAHIAAQLARTHALVELHALEAHNTAKNPPHHAPPLVHNLASHPPPGVGVDLRNLVAYPPTGVQAVPVKPLFLDVGWNYIVYPGKVGGGGGEGGVVAAAVADVKDAVMGDAGEEKKKVEEKKVEEKKVEEGAGKKRGWFGFGGR